MNHSLSTFLLFRDWKPFRSLAIATIVLVGGCNGHTNHFGDFGASDNKWFDRSAVKEGSPETLPNQAKDLAGGSDLKVAVHNAIQLGDQKRFIEARHILAGIRSNQKPDGEGYQALSGAMAILSLREGNIVAFKRVARQLDTALGSPLSVPADYLEIISFYRILSNGQMPVNASDGMKRLKDKFFANEEASQ